MAELIFGVVDVSYSDTQNSGKPTTTAKVAEYLEDHYSVMRIFFELRKQQIAGYLADSLANALQDRLNGHSTRSSPTYGAEQQIDAEFRAFLASNEINTAVMLDTGAPVSQSAAQGVSHRRKAPAAKRDARAAFIDSGLYMTSFRAEVKL